MIQLNSFIQKFAVRTLAHFTQPPLPLVTKFELPMLAMVHYVSSSATNPWPNADMLYYQNNTKPLRITHHTALIENKGNPKLQPGDVNSLIRDFRKKNPRFRPAIDIESMKRDPRAIVTHNYGLLLERYRYQRGMFTFHNRWHNVFATLFHNVGDNIRSGYHQYLEIQLPAKLPSRTALDRSADGWNAKNMSIFNSYEMIMLHHLWVWMGERRDESLLHKYVGDVTNVKLILREGERFTIIDLALLEQWRKPSEQQKRAYEEEHRLNGTMLPLKKGSLTPSELQRSFLRMLMAIMELRNKDMPENLGDDSQFIKTESTTSNSDTDDTVVFTAKSITVDGELTEEQAFAGYDEELDKRNFLAEIDKDLDVLEITGSEDKLQNSPTENQDDAQLDDDDSDIVNPDKDNTTAIAREIEFYPTDVNAAFKRQLARAADSTAITAAEYRRLSESSEQFSTAEAPLGFNGTMQEYISIPSELLAVNESPSIPDQQTIIDKSMLKSSLLGWNERYSRDIMQRDIASMVAQVQAAGVMINKYNVTEVEDITGSHYVYSIQVKPIEGASSTLSMKIPKVDDDGRFRISGTSYVTRNQRVDLPIRKISASQVGLTSYYGKIFVERSERRVNDWGKWIRGAVMARGLNVRDNLVTNMVPGSSFTNEVKVPRTISAIAQGFRQFTLRVEDKAFDCNFDAKKMRIVQGATPMVEVGICQADGAIIYCDFDDNFYIQENGVLREAPSIETMLDLDARKAPVEFAEVKIFGKHIPSGVVLGYLLGFENVIQLIQPPSMRIVPVGKRSNLIDDEWSINFDDKTYVFSRRDRLASLVFGGWREFSNTTTRFPTDEFNSKEVYFNLFEEKKLGVRYLRELDLLEQMFVDPITRDILISMNEPTVFTKLILRSCEMLCLDQHPDSQDPHYMRIRGYERFSGAVYSELVRSIRIHNGRPGKHRYGLELNPYAVWIGIQQDPAKDQVSEINPIQNLKEVEAVTYSGTGGRGSRSMVKATRIYHRNDMSIISESTVDSSDVAINVFTSADPQFNSLRGTVRKGYDYKKDGITSLLSTSALVSPGSTKDDPKRVNFIGIQNRHVVACDGYKQAIVRTGYEQVIPHRVGDLFAVTAKKPGKVLSITPDGIVIQYEGEEKPRGYVLGRRFGSAAGLTIPHTIKSDMVANQTFAVGEPIAYNTGFFERDMLNPKQIVWKSSMLAKVAIMESPDTLEDSSAISKRISQEMLTEQIKIKDIVINFDQSVHRMVKEGQAVDPESMLCIIEDAVSARNNFLDEETLDTLRVLGAQTPQAKIKGKIERIEVYYNGDLEDMSESLLSLVKSSDKRIAARNVAIGRKAYTGSVTEEFRIGTDPLLMDTACIRIYMSAKVAAGVGDKGVFGNQLKTVFGRVFDNNVKTESNTPIDAIFGAKSLYNRIVTSPYLIGTTTTLLIVGTKRVVKAYRSN